MASRSKAQTPAEIGAAAMARFGTLQRRLATEYPHHIFAHSSVERLGERMARPLTEEERTEKAIVAEDRDFFAAVIDWAKAGIALSDLRERAATSTQGQIGERATTGEGEDDGEDF